MNLRAAPIVSLPLLGWLAFSPFLARAADPPPAAVLAESLSAREARAFNEHSSPAFASLYAPDADGFVVVDLGPNRHEVSRVVGRPAIQNALDAFLARYPRARMERVVENARYISPDVLFVDCSIRVSELNGDVPYDMIAVLVYKKTGDAWLIAAERIGAHLMNGTRKEPKSVK